MEKDRTMPDHFIYLLAKTRYSWKSIFCFFQNKGNHQFSGKTNLLDIWKQSTNSINFILFNLISLGQVTTTQGWINIMPKISLNREECRLYLKNNFQLDLDLYVLLFRKTYKGLMQIYGALSLCSDFLLRASASLKFYPIFLNSARCPCSA